MCVTIYPNYADLVVGNYDQNLHTFMSGAQQREMLSCWHEASSGNKQDANGYIKADMQIAMQKYLYIFAKTGLGYPNQPAWPTPDQIKNPVYKCAVGAVDIGHWATASPWMAPNLDFYGMDLYHATFSDPIQGLDEWKTPVYGGYSPNATIAVCECNCDDDSQRAEYFFEEAYWVWSQENRDARSFLTFWDGTGDMGGCWPPGPAAVAELKRIGYQSYCSPVSDLCFPT